VPRPSGREKTTGLAAGGNCFSWVRRNSLLHGETGGEEKKEVTEFLAERGHFGKRGGRLGIKKKEHGGEKKVETKGRAILPQFFYLL